MKKIIPRGLAMAGLFLMLSVSSALPILAAPPNIFGGGERAIHINENAAPTANSVTVATRIYSANQVHTSYGTAESIGVVGAVQTEAVHFNIATGGNVNNIVQQDYSYGTFLGTLRVERLNRSVRIYGGASMAAMDRGAGHFSFTGLTSGNIGLIGHNRGARNGFFSFVRLLQEGDILTLDVGDTVRTFQVAMEEIVDETDFSLLQQFGDNRLTLVTCVEYVRNQRRIAVAFEV